MHDEKWVYLYENLYVYLYELMEITTYHKQKELLNKRSKLFTPLMSHTDHKQVLITWVLLKQLFYTYLRS